MITWVDELKHIAQTLVEEQIFMIRQEEKSGVIDNIKEVLKNYNKFSEFANKES